MGSIFWSGIIILPCSSQRGEEESQIKGFDLVFIHCGRDEGRIPSMDWINTDGSSIWTIVLGAQRPTRIMVKLWDIRYI